jgi:hypothetical protein
MVLYPWLHNSGFLLYRDIGNPYFPLLTWVLSFWTKTFGFSQESYVTFTWGFIFITELLFIFIALKIFKNKSKVFFAFLIYVILLIIFEGNGLWFDLICTLPLLLSFYFLINKKYIFVGICLGISLLIKQTTIWVILGSFFYVFIQRQGQPSGVKKIITMLIPIGIVLGIVVVFFYQQGTFPDFFYWTIKLAFGGMQSKLGFVELPTRRNLIVIALTFWPLLLSFKDIYRKKEICLATIFCVATMFFAFPRFGYFHLIASLPFLSIVATNVLENKLIKGVYLTILFVLLINFVKINSPFSIRFFSTKTFQKNSALDKYFIKNKLPNKPWIDNFPWYPKKNDQ